MDKLLWLPMDVPPLPDISNIMTQDDTWEGFAYWKFLRLTEKKTNPYDVSNWKNAIKNLCPELILWFDYLPFKNLRNVKLNLQTRIVNGHIDFTNPAADPDLWKNNSLNEPCGYRILVNGSRSNCLWVEKNNGNIVHCDMPETTDTYVLNHTAGMHGVTDDVNRWTIFCHAEIDNKKHDKIVSRSLSMYKQYAVWDM